jgi:hypothetical protein
MKPQKLTRKSHSIVSIQLDGNAEYNLSDVSAALSVNELFDIIAESELEELKEEMGQEEWDFVRPYVKISPVSREAIRKSRAAVLIFGARQKINS